MDTQIDKQELKNWIDRVDDQAILEGIQSLKESTESTEGSDWWHEISDAEKAGIKRGLDDAKAGRVISNEDFWKKHESRL